MSVLHTGELDFANTPCFPFTFCYLDVFNDSIGILKKRFRVLKEVVCFLIRGLWYSTVSPDPQGNVQVVSASVSQTVH